MPKLKSPMCPNCTERFVGSIPAKFVRIVEDRNAEYKLYKFNRTQVCANCHRLVDGAVVWHKSKQQAQIVSSSSGFIR